MSLAGHGLATNLVGRQAPSLRVDGMMTTSHCLPLTLHLVVLPLFALSPRHSPSPLPTMSLIIRLRSREGTSRITVSPDTTGEDLAQQVSELKSRASVLHVADAKLTCTVSLLSRSSTHSRTMSTPAPSPSPTPQLMAPASLSTRSPTGPSLTWPSSTPHVTSSFARSNTMLTCFTFPSFHLPPTGTARCSSSTTKLKAPPPARPLLSQPPQRPSSHQRPPSRLRLRQQQRHFLPHLPRLSVFPRLRRNKVRYELS